MYNIACWEIHLGRACFIQLLITIRSFTLLCDYSRSKTRLIVIMNLLDKLEIICATACHASLCTTVTVAAQRLLLYTNGEGEVGISESVTAAVGALGLCKVLCWLLLIASRNTLFLPSSARQSYTPLPPAGNDRLTDRRQPSMHTGVTLPAQWPT